MLRQSGRFLLGFFLSLVFSPWVTAQIDPPGRARTLNFTGRVVVEGDQTHTLSFEKGAYVEYDASILPTGTLRDIDVKPLYFDLSIPQFIVSLSGADLYITFSTSRIFDPATNETLGHYLNSSIAVEGEVEEIHQSQRFVLPTGYTRQAHVSQVYRIGGGWMLGGLVGPFYSLDHMAFDGVIGGAHYQVMVDEAYWTEKDVDIILSLVPGDYDNDSRVDQVDLDFVLLNWGSGYMDGALFPTWNQVDQDDLDKILLGWGKSESPLRVGSIPEPPSIVYVLVVCAAAAFHNRLWKR